MKRHTLLFVMVLIVTVGAAGAATAPPVAVSPGSTRGVTKIDQRCPTFSWGAVEEAETYDLVVYRVAQDAGLSKPVELEAVLKVTLPGTALAWTPSLARCLEPGGRYAWTLRGITAEGAGEWSEASLFEVSGVPSVAEVDEALAVLRRYRDHGGAGEIGSQILEGSARQAPAGGHLAGAMELKGVDQRAVPVIAGSTTESVPVPDFTAIKGHVADTSGVTFGVHGVSASTEDGSSGVVGVSTASSGQTAGVMGQVGSASGTAGVFDNTAGGKILSGLNNGSEIFSVEADGAVMAAGNVDVGGTVTAPSFAGDGSGLSGVSAEDLACTDCVGAGDLETDSVGSSEVIDNSIASADLAPDSVGSSEIIDGSVGPNDLALNSVDSTKVSDNSLTANDLAPNAVTASEIAGGAVGPSEMAGSFCLVRKGGNACPSGYVSFFLRWDTEDAFNNDICTVPPAAACDSAGVSDITLYFCCK